MLEAYRYSEVLDEPRQILRRGRAVCGRPPLPVARRVSRRAALVRRQDGARAADPRARRHAGQPARRRWRRQAAGRSRGLLRHRDPLSRSHAASLHGALPRLRAAGPAAARAGRPRRRRRVRDGALAAAVRLAHLRLPVVPGRRRRCRDVGRRRRAVPVPAEPADRDRAPADSQHPVAVSRAVSRPHGLGRTAPARRPLYRSVPLARDVPVVRHGQRDGRRRRRPVPAAVVAEDVRRPLARGTVAGRRRAGDCGGGGRCDRPRAVARGPRRHGRLHDPGVSRHQELAADVRPAAPPAGAGVHRRADWRQLDGRVDDARRGRAGARLRAADERPCPAAGG